MSGGVGAESMALGPSPMFDVCLFPLNVTSWGACMHVGPREAKG